MIAYSISLNINNLFRSLSTVLSFSIMVFVILISLLYSSSTQEWDHGKAEECKKDVKQAEYKALRNEGQEMYCKSTG